MSRRPSVGEWTRQKIIERYGGMCVKCGRKKRLEIHHITLVMNGGKDNYFNLVPLCRECHRFAPDDYIEFLKYLGSHYNPHMDAMRTIAFAMSKYFHEMTDEEYKEFKSMTTETFFKNKMEGLFFGLKKLVYGFDEDVIDGDMTDLTREDNAVIKSD